jgi:hypothetical protein
VIGHLVPVDDGADLEGNLGLPCSGLRARETSVAGTSRIVACPGNRAIGRLRFASTTEQAVG